MGILVFTHPTNDTCQYSFMTLHAIDVVRVNVIIVELLWLLVTDLVMIVVPIVSVQPK